jgi:hypothetical protein
LHPWKQGEIEKRIKDIIGLGQDLWDGNKRNKQRVSMKVLTMDLVYGRKREVKKNC